MSQWFFQHFLLIVPLLFIVAGWWCGYAKKSSQLVAKHALLLTVIVFIATVVGIIFHFVIEKDTNNSVFINTGFVNLAVLILVVTMAWVLLKFSYHYMAGEQRVGSYCRWMLITLGAVALTVIIDHLLIFWLSWVLISLSLHKILTFYPERPRAILAAHKKFLLARSAEVFLLTAFILLYVVHQTFSISELSTLLSLNQVNAEPLSALENWAAVFIALAALIKCAQLPIHGWLIQVVESPTPVSALLHAGVINLGGFLLIIFAPLFIQSNVAQWLVLIVAGFSTVLSALIMTTRISYKVRLAWSTSAQMGLMLIECALGLFELALLHLLAHSAYKAHAFLNSGQAVYEGLSQRLSPQTIPPLKDWLFAGAGALLLTTSVIVITAYKGPMSVWLIFTLALSLLLVQQPRAFSKLAHVVIIIFGAVVIVSYMLQKMFFSYEMSELVGFQVAAFSGPDWWVMVLFLILFVVHLLRFYQSHWSPVQRLSLALFAGLYLDEWFTRMTLKIWPVQLPKSIRKKP